MKTFKRQQLEEQDQALDEIIMITKQINKQAININKELKRQS
jgi:hypothetical protein